VQRRPGGKFQVAVVEQPQADVDAQRRREQSRIGKPVAAGDRALVDAREVDCAALAGVPVFGSLVLRVDTAHPRLQAGRHHCHGVAGPHLARENCPGCNDAVTRQREDPIHRQSEHPVVQSRRL
jgi:hypothetical protein